MFLASLNPLGSLFEKPSQNESNKKAKTYSADMDEGTERTLLSSESSELSISSDSTEIVPVSTSVEKNSSDLKSTATSFGTTNDDKTEMSTSFHILIDGKVWKGRMNIVQSTSVEECEISSPANGVFAPGFDLCGVSIVSDIMEWLLLPSKKTICS